MEFDSNSKVLSLGAPVLKVNCGGLGWGLLLVANGVAKTIYGLKSPAVDYVTLCSQQRHQKPGV